MRRISLIQFPYLPDRCLERDNTLSLMYNVRSTVNPLNGEQYGPNTLGLLSKVEKIFTDEGHLKGDGG